MVSTALDAGGAEESGVASIGSSIVGPSLSFFATGGVEGGASGMRLRPLVGSAGTVSVGAQATGVAEATGCRSLISLLIC